MGVPAAQGRATPLELVATVGHALSGAEAWLHLDCLRNPLDGGHSGSIRVRLIASSRPIGDSPFEYWDLAHFVLDVLPAGESHRHVDRVVGLTLPPDGIYHLALGVFEFDSRQPLGGARSEWLVDHCTFAGLLSVQAGRILGSAARSVVMRAAPPAASGRRSWFPWLRPRTARFA